MKKLLSASFLDSLNLLDDEMIVYMDKDTNSRSIYNGKNKVGFIIISLLCLSFNLFLPIISKYLMSDNSINDILLSPDINLLPSWLAYLFFALWIAVWLITSKKKYIATEISVRMFNVNTYLIIFMLELNLFFLTFFLKALSFIGVIILFAVITCVAIVLINSKKRNLEKLLFDMEFSQSRLDILIEKWGSKFLRYGSVLVLIFMIWKYFSSVTIDYPTDFIGLIGIISMWFVLDIGFILVEIYLVLPYLLFGFYKSKYSEDYREWYDKSQLEWYGKNSENK